MDNVETAKFEYPEISIRRTDDGTVWIIDGKQSVGNEYAFDRQAYPDLNEKEELLIAFVNFLGLESSELLNFNVSIDNNDGICEAYVDVKDDNENNVG